MDEQIKMFIAGEEVVSNQEFTINEEMLSASSTILNNCYPKSWELTKDYVSRFYFPKDYSKFVLGKGNFLYGNDEFSTLESVGKNLFDKNGASLISGYVNYNTGVFTAPTGNNQKCFYVKVTPSTKYTWTNYTTSATVGYGLYTDIPQATNSASSYGQITSTKTITTGINDNYLVMFYSASNAVVDFETFIIAEGETAIYEPYDYSTLQYKTNVEKEWDSLQLEGNTYQEIADRNKNLAFITSVSNQLGLTITQISNSEIKINGTANANGEVKIPLYATQLSTSFYTMSAIITGTVSTTVPAIDLNTSMNLSLFDITGAGTYTQSSNAESSSNIVTEMAITINSGTVFTNFDIKIQLEKSSTATSYEVAQMNKPSPYTSSELISVGYENLFDGKIRQGNAYNTTISNRLYSINDVYVTQGEIYTINTNLNTTTYRYAINISLNPHPNSSQVQDSGWKTTASYTFTANYTGYLGIPISKINDGNLTLTDVDGIWFQITKGTQAHTYIPYNKYGIEVKTTGKNIWNEEWENGYYNRTSGAKGSGNNYIRSADYIPITPNTSIYFNKPSDFVNYAVLFYDSSLTKLGGTTATNTTSQSFTSPSNASYFTFYGDTGLSNATYQNNIIITKGTQATTYEPYKSNTQLYILDNPLRSIGNVKDKLYIQNGYLYVERNIGSVILNGSENWLLNSTSDSQYRYWITYANFRNIFTNIITGTENQLMGKLLCNRFTQALFSNTNIGKFSINNANNNDWFLLNSEKTSVANFKTWLSTHNTEVNYILATPYTEELGAVNLPSSYEGINNVYCDSGITNGRLSLNYYWKNYDVLFAGIVKNSGDISLNPRYPHYCSLQILDYKTFLSESDTLDFVISEKTIAEAIEMVVNAVSDYGFIVGNINISQADEIIGAYSTLNKTAYDVLQYLANISGSRWRARFINETTMAIDFYDPNLLPQASDIEYTKQYWEDNNIVDLTFNYGTRDYRNKQIVLSDEVYASISYTEVVLSNGYNTNFITQQNVGIVTSVTVNGIEKDVISQKEKELGADADFYYTPGKNVVESASSYTAGTQIAITYIPLVKGRQIVYNDEEVTRIAVQTNTSGIISRYENRNDIVSSQELEQIGETYIEYKGKPEIILTLTTEDIDLFNIGEVTYFNAPINELQQTYMVKTKKTQYIISGEQRKLFYIYELTSSFNSEKAINYFDNQRNKATGNIQEGESITRNIDINNSAVIIWDNPTITEISISIDGNNALNSVLNSPFIE